MAVATSPRVDRDAATALGRALRRAGYTENAVHDLLGDDAYSIERNAAPVEARRLPRTPLATIVRLFFLQLQVATEDATRALGSKSVDALQSTGLADVDAKVRPRSRILPVGEVILASDGYSREAEDPPDYVATYTPTSRLCDSLTPRPTVERALDVGTGPGIHALLAAQHAGHVIATDVNDRALAYTALNAALNELDNIECRHGSLFEPVAGERFDLITCNAPYVVSPERRWAYRDSGFKADQLSEQVVEAAAEHLNDGGLATLLVSWLAHDDDAPNERALAWTRASGCDGWIISTIEADPLSHAADWNSHLTGDPEAFAKAVDEWKSYLDELGVRWVSEGAILLHRRPGPIDDPRVDSLDEDELEEAGDQILRAFAARARLAQVSSDDELLDAPLSLAATVRLEEELEPDRDGPVIGDAWIRLADGTKSSLEVEDDVLDVVAELDGGLRLGQAVDNAADRLELSDAERTKLRRDAVRASRELLELGALMFVE
jgi:methylase of polypeptide subunit release factors